MRFAWFAICVAACGGGADFTVVSFVESKPCGADAPSNQGYAQLHVQEADDTHFDVEGCRGGCELITTFDGKFFDDSESIWMKKDTRVDWSDSAQRCLIGVTERVLTRTGNKLVLDEKTNSDERAIAMSNCNRTMFNAQFMFEHLPCTRHATSEATEK